MEIKTTLELQKHPEYMFGYEDAREKWVSVEDLNQWLTEIETDWQLGKNLYKVQELRDRLK